MTKPSTTTSSAKKASPRKPKTAPVKATQAETARTASPTKTDAVIALLRRPEGASIDEIMATTGWQRHSVRGAVAGAVKKKLGSAVQSELADGIPRYRAPELGA